MWICHNKDKILFIFYLFTFIYIKAIFGLNIGGLVVLVNNFI